MLKTLVGLELGIGRGHRINLPEPETQLLLGVAQRRHVAQLARRGDGAARPQHFFQGFLLVGHVTLAGLDELRQLVVTQLEQHVDIRPGFGHTVFRADQIDINQHTVYRRGGEQAHEYERANIHRCILRSDGAMLCYPSYRRRGRFLYMEHFDLIAIGGGSGGRAVAQRAAHYGARGAVVEPGELGGTCVNSGCVPKKVMWHAAELAHTLVAAEDYGFGIQNGSVDWPGLVEARDAYITRLNTMYATRLDEAGITRLRGYANFVDAHRIAVGDAIIGADHIVIATGGRPLIPNFDGAELGSSSDGFFALRTQPKRVAIVGSGYIAAELSGVFSALGSEVTLA